jgi:outer membrane protein TolC
MKHNSIIIILFIQIIYGYSLSFDEYLESLDNYRDIQLVKILTEQYEYDLELLEYPGNIEITLHPEVSTDPVELSSYPESYTFSGSSGSISIPVGLSRLEKDTLYAAMLDYDYSLLEYEKAKTQFFYRIYLLYNEAFLIQQLLDVTLLELNASKLKAETVFNLLETGQATNIEYLKAQEELVEQQAAFNRTKLEYQLLLSELEQYSILQIVPGELTQETKNIPLLPDVSELLNSAYLTDSSIIFTNNVLSKLQNRINALNGSFITASLGTEFTIGDHILEAGYDITKPTITTSYTYKPLTTQQNDDITWSAGFSLNINISVGRELNLEIEKLILDEQSTKEELYSLLQAIQLEIRTAVAGFYDLENKITQNQRLLALAEEQLNDTTARMNSGTVMEYEQIEAKAFFKRAEWNYMNAEYESEKQLLSISLLSGYIPEYFKNYIRSFYEG